MAQPLDLSWDFPWVFPWTSLGTSLGDRTGNSTEDMTGQETGRVCCVLCIVRCSKKIVFASPCEQSLAISWEFPWTSLGTYLGNYKGLGNGSPARPFARGACGGRYEPRHPCPLFKYINTALYASVFVLYAVDLVCAKATEQVRRHDDTEALLSAVLACVALP